MSKAKILETLEVKHLVRLSLGWQLSLTLDGLEAFSSPVRRFDFLPCYRKTSEDLRHETSPDVSDSIQSIMNEKSQSLME